MLPAPDVRRLYGTMFDKIRTADGVENILFYSSPVEANVIKALTHLKVKMLIIDEIHNILAGRNDKEHELMTTRHADIFNELAKKIQDQQHWQEQFQTLQAKCDEQNKSFLELQTQHVRLSPQSETMEVELKELREQNKLLAHEKWGLGQEKAQLYGQLKQLQSSSI